MRGGSARAIGRWIRLLLRLAADLNDRFRALETDLGSVKADTKESVELLRSIKLGGSFLKWFVAVSAGLAVVFGTIWSVLVYGHKP